jgi:hypothetical protein
MGLAFTKRLRDGVRTGSITCTVRIWQRCHVKVGGRYRMDPGEVEVTSISPLGLSEITSEMARRGGFKGLVDLLKIAQHGPGRNVYLIEFRYLDAQHKRAPAKDLLRPAGKRARRGQRTS